MILQEVAPATCYQVSDRDDTAAVATDNENTTVQQEDKGDDVEPAASTSLMSFRDLVPLPHKERPANAKKRRVGHAECITSSPYKRQLEESLLSPSTSKPGGKTKPRRKRSDAPARKKTNQRKKAKSNASDVEAVDTTPCLFCQIPYNESRVAWWQCRQCSGWACAKCACVGKEKTFVCGMCL